MDSFSICYKEGLRHDCMDFRHPAQDNGFLKKLMHLVRCHAADVESSREMRIEEGIAAVRLLLEGRARIPASGSGHVGFTDW